MKSTLVFTVIAIIVVICILPQACEKDDENSESFNLLTAHTWNYDTIYTICQDPEIVWFIDMLEDAVKGLTVKYTADGKFVSTNPKNQVL